MVLGRRRTILVRLRDLERVASAYRNQRQYAVVGQPQLGFSQASQDNLPRPIAVLPFQAVAIAGDVISNLRSARDHLAWQLVESAGGRPGRHTGFPIFDSLERYDKGKGGKVQGMRQEAIERSTGSHRTVARTETNRSGESITLTT